MPSKKQLPDVHYSPVDVPDSTTTSDNLIGDEAPDLISLLVDDKGDRYTQVPEAALKNRAAYAALLSGSPNLSELYQGMLAENKQGVDYTRQAIMDKILPKVDAEARQGIFSILADPRYSDEQKKAAMESYKDGFMREPATILANNAYQQPSKGETPEAEDVRISGAEQFRGIQENNQYLQGIKNRQEAIRSQNGQTQFFDEFLESVIPFATNINAARNLKELADKLKLDYSRTKAFFMPGSIAKDISDAIDKMPPDQQMRTRQKLYEVIQNNNKIIFNRDNQFNATNMTGRLLGGEYSTVDKWIDNGAALLDVFSLGLIGSAKNAAVKLTSKVTRTPESAEQKLIQRGVSNTTSPVSPLAVLREANPEKAKAALKVVVDSNSEEVAQALTGASRTDAIAAEALPQVKVADNTVETKIIQPDADILKATELDGGYRFTEAERKSAQAHAVNDMDNLAGLTTLDNLTTIGVKGDKLTITGMFGNANGGFKVAEEAVNQAKFALKEYGVTERDIQLFKKIDNEYVPISLEEAKGVDGNYVIGVDFEHQLGTDGIKWEELDVKRNWLDRIGITRTPKSGTAANHLMTAASMLHPTITGSASVAVDKGVRIDKLFLKMHEQFSERFTKLSKDQKGILWEHIKEANRDGLELADGALRAKGLTQDSIDTLKQWRKNWDTHFYFENADVARSLDRQGYRVFEGRNNTKFFAKETPKNGNIREIYDPALDQVRAIDRVEIDALYAAGGHYAQFRRPIKINGVEVEHMIVRNTPTEFLRKISSADQILNYRKGYFQTAYKAPWYIEEVVRTTGGAEKYRKAIHMAGSEIEAKHLQQRLATSNQRSLDDYIVRQDSREFRPDTDAYWDLQHASGRIAQRHRGKQLEEAVGHASGFADRFILNPMESAMRASHSLSTRIAMRDVIDAHKARAMDQYGHLFPKVEGQVKWVENSNSLIHEGMMTRGEIADARTTVEYINYLQRGYHNALDSFYKAGMNFMAETMAKWGTVTGEKAFNLAKELDPMGIMKNGVFQAYIAVNPLRQFLVQSHQAVRLFGYNPTGLIKASNDASIYAMHAIGSLPWNKLTKEQQEMVDFVKHSGMLDAVDKHNLVAGSISALAESQNKIARGIGKVFAIPRKLGFDIGEQTNLIMHMLTVRDKYIKAGKNVTDPTIRDEIYSVSRAISYDMNRAGDMPYNSNAFGLFLQFMQVPHKAISAVTTNRRIPWQDRVKMAGMDLLLFGIPSGTALMNLIGKDMLPEDPEMRETALFGLTSELYNAALSKIAGERTEVDFSTLSPYNTEGFGRFFEAIMTGGIVEFFQDSPSFTFYFKDDSRMRTALTKLFRFAGMMDTEPGQEPEDILSVLKGTASLFSGVTNAQKAMVIAETGKLLDKKGATLASDLNWVHAAAQLFGLQPMEVKLAYEAQKEGAAFSKQHEKDVIDYAKHYVTVLASNNKLTPEEGDYQVRALGAAMLRFKNDPEGMRIFNEYLKRELPNLRDKIIPNAIRYANIPDSENHSAALTNLKMLKKEEYENVLKLREDMHRNIKQMYEEK